MDCASVVDIPAGAAVGGDGGATTGGAAGNELGGGGVGVCTGGGVVWPSACGRCSCPAGVEGGGGVGCFRLQPTAAQPIIVAVKTRINP